MKKLIAAVMAAILTVTMISFAVLADETDRKETPSGISYDEIKDSIDGYIKEREAGLASAAVSVFDGDGVILEKHYGYSDIENKTLADEDTVYEWGSTSKILVWTSVMQQRERGSIDLDADIRKYLPEGFLSKLQYPDEKISMIDLMCHKAGFQESFYENQEADPDDVYADLEEAVRKCECYQAYHPGEYTSYSNWGTALAAYIVERTSGLDYVTYVNENIFKPLGMEHTSADPLQRDNEWVKNKRRELKCYDRYADPQYNADYGECRYAVQLFPAGSVIGTVADLGKLGQAFVADDCPLFNDESSRKEMLSATSYFGGTDIEKNCHGLWVQHHKVKTLGHDGNTGGCTAALEFDPESGLGIAVMVNEPGETAFCCGIPVLLYGHITDREEYADAVACEEDISGTYYFTRSISEGAAKASQYALFMPLAKNEDGSYSAKILGIELSSMQYHSLGDGLYVSVDNGREMLVYIKDGIYELGFFDCVKSAWGSFPTYVSYGFSAFGIICLLVLAVKLTAALVRKIRKTERKYKKADRLILAEQILYGVSGVIFLLFINVIGSYNAVFTAVSAVLAALLAAVSPVLGITLCYETIAKDEKISIKIKQFIWALLGVAYTVFIIGMQLYCFWKL